MKSKVFDTVLEFASEHQGIVTSKDAANLGIDPAHLRVMAARGRLERIGRGAYRVPTLPIGELAQYAEAAAWAAGRAAVSHESALLMRDLGDFGGSRIDLTVPSDYQLRRAVPRRLRVWVEDLGVDELDELEGVPTVTVATALRQVVDSGSDPFQVHAAIGHAMRVGFIDQRAGRRLRYRLDHRPAAGRRSPNRR
jgi:predicted transcriptional regulator of viral defense system